MARSEMCTAATALTSIFVLLIQITTADRIDPIVATVGLFTQCQNGYKVVRDEGRTRVLIDGRNFAQYPDRECSAVFRASDPHDELYYEIKTFTMMDSDTEVLIESKNTLDREYREEESIHMYNSPHLGRTRLTSTYIRITARRGSGRPHHGRTMFMSIDLYTHNHWNEFSHVFRLTVGAIIGIVLGAIALIVIIIIVVCCCILKPRRRHGHRDGVVMTSHPRNQHTAVPVTVVGTYPSYPYGQGPAHPKAYQIQPFR